VAVRVHVSDRERQERTRAAAQQEPGNNNNKKTKAPEDCADYWGQDKDKDKNKNRQNGTPEGSGRRETGRQIDGPRACVQQRYGRARLGRVW
jgi:hypothetical protein